MPSKKPGLEEAYDEVDYTITDCTYTDNVITIDLYDEDILKDFDITNATITNNSSGGITMNNNYSTEFNWEDITVKNPYQDICEYVGIDVNLPPEDFEKMCKRYPALQKALEQFQNTYNLVKDDWETERKTQ